MKFVDSLDGFEEAYTGEWDSEEDLAQHIVDEYYDLEKTMDILSNFFDYKRYADELFMFDFYFEAA